MSRDGETGTDIAAAGRPRATILDVAQRAGVSLGTVSYVITGRRRVSDARRQRVLQAIDDLNYVPNSLAQSLRSGHSKLIGICLPNNTTALFGQLFQHFEGIAASHGFEVVQVLNHSDEDVEHRRLTALFAHRVGGLLIAPAGDGVRSGPLVAQARVPTVVLDRGFAWSHCDEVVVDNAAAAEEVADRLAAFGHRHVLFIATFPSLITTKQRILGLANVTNRTSGQFRVEIFESGNDQTAFAARLTQRLAGPDPPTAIIASNARIGMWTVRTLRAMRLRWPEDVSLILFEHPDWADILQPAVSFVDMPTGTMAEAAWDLLMARMIERTAAVQRTELRATVVITPSVAAPSAPG